MSRPRPVTLPTDPVTGRILPGPGRPRGQPDLKVRLAKDQAAEAFLRLGGVDAFVKWIEESRHNRRLFYATIWPRLLPAQAVEAAAAKLAEAPQITRIENLIIESRDGRVVETPVPSTVARDRTVEDVPYVEVEPEPPPPPERPAPEPPPANGSQRASALTPEQIEDELATIEEERRRIRHANGKLMVERQSIEAAEKRRAEKRREAERGNSWY